ELVLAIHFGNLDDGHVEGTTTQVVDHHGGVTTGLVYAVGQRRGCGLVADALDVQTGDTPGVLGRLGRAVVEVGRIGVASFRHRLAKVVRGGLLHLFPHYHGHLRRRHLLALGFDPGIAVVGLDDLVGHQFDVLLPHFLIEAATD